MALSFIKVEVRLCYFAYKYPLGDSGLSTGVGRVGFVTYIVYSGSSDRAVGIGPRLPELLVRSYRIFISRLFDFYVFFALFFIGFFVFV